MSNENSRHLYDLAVKHIPGGVNSPVRAFKGVGGNPLFFKAGQDAYLIDADNNRYVDYVGGFGPLILGHCHEGVTEALRNQLQQGLAFGASTEAEVQIADKICELMPSIEKVRLVTSGTEATMSAIRLARGYTGRDRIVKFEGCYHGHVDGLLVKAGSGALDPWANPIHWACLRPIPTSPMCSPITTAQHWKVSSPRMATKSPA